MKKSTSFNYLLSVSFLFIGGLIFGRIFFTGTITHLFLIWNIFLAWIPYFISIRLRSCKENQKAKQVFLFFGWLLFFPNALYLITDLIHIRETEHAPVWFDTMLLFTAALMGLLFAFLSLFQVEKYLSGIVSRKMVVFLIPFLLIVSSFGVYLGRFERWNSWDIISNPIALSNDILKCIVAPMENIRSWAVTATLSVLFYLIYAFAKMIPHMTEQKNNQSETD